MVLVDDGQYCFSASQYKAEYTHQLLDIENERYLLI